MFRTLKFERLESRRLLTATWTGGRSGNWDVPGNWSTGVVPDSSTPVAIDTSGATVTIQPGETENAQSLTLGAGATLALPGALNATFPTANWLANSDFESPVATNSTTAPATWWSWGSAYLSQEYAYTGSQSLVVSGENSGVTEQPSAVTPGNSYTASVYAMVSADLTGSATGYILLLFFDSSENLISSYTAPNSVAVLTASSATGGPLTGSVGSEGWNHFSTTAVAPSNAAYAEAMVEIYGGTASNFVYFDDLTLGPAAPGPSTLDVGTLSNSGTLSVGAANTVNVSDGFTQASTGTLDIQLGGRPSTGGFGLIDISGAAALAGTLKADVLSGYAPATTDTFTPIEFSSETGGFSGETMPSGSGYQFEAATTFTNVVISAAPSTTVTATVSASTSLHAVTTNLLGINMVYWDPDTGTAQTQQMLTTAGLDIYRFPGGSASDVYHFNVADNYYDGSQTLPDFVQAVTANGGTGLVTLDYGSGSPQEAEAELAYLEGSPTDTTPIANGTEWVGTPPNQTEQTFIGHTVGYWASLRAAKPLATDDGLNFLRLNHPTPFTDIKYWEVGNEEYGSWETNHYATNASTDAANPATYAAFAAQFAALASTVLTDAGLPQSTISIGIDSGDPTGASDDDWTKNVLSDGLVAGFVPGFISDHSYMQAPGAESDSFLLNDTVSDSGSVLDWDTRYADYQAVLDETLGSQAAGVQVMATEYNSVYTDPGKQSTSLVNGLFVAESLGSLLDSGYSGGFVWDLRNSFDSSSDQNSSNLLYGWREGGDYGQLGDPNTNSPPTTGPYIAYPGYYALELASKIIQSGGEVVPATSSYGDLDVYAVMESGGDLELLVINTNPAAAVNSQFDVTGFQPAGPAEVWQYGKTQDTAQSQSSNGVSALAESSAILSLSGADFNYTFPAYSMTVLDLAPSQTLTSIAVTLAANKLAASGTEQFSATAYDQFDRALITQPAFAWSVSGGGKIDASGEYSPPYAAGSATIRATAGGVTGSTTVTLPGAAQWTSTAAAWWTEGNWTGSTSGTAISPPGLRGVVGDMALFASAGVTVSLDGAEPVLAGITFDSPTSYSIDAGTGGFIQLNDGSSPATLTVDSGSHTIDAPLQLASRVIVDPAAGSSLFITQAISGDGGSLTLDGAGELVLSGDNTYSGGTRVVAGRLTVTVAASLPTGKSLIVGADGLLMFDPTA